MGYMRHHVIVVTTYNEELAQNLHRQAADLFGSAQVTPVLKTPVNVYYTFVVGPCGSKLGWSNYQEYEDQRHSFIQALNILRYGDGSTPLKWVEIQYGDDDGDNKMLDHDELYHDSGVLT